MAANTNKTLELPARGMDLEQTLFCGQSFVWRQAEGGRFTGVAGARSVDTWLENDTLCLTKPDGDAFTDEDRAFWQHYFALDIDYPTLQTCFCRNGLLAECVARAPGIRVLRQPFFDTLLCFILSQNNHIQRITGIVQRLCDGFGPPLPGGRHGLPRPETLAALSPEALEPLRAGFRARYLIDAAQCVASGRVSEAAIATMADAEARAYLKQIVGVGDKVADCVLLYALGRNSVVPMDVWMKRAMKSRFPTGMPPEAAGHEGIAQQYIFLWARENWTE